MPKVHFKYDYLTLCENYILPYFWGSQTFFWYTKYNFLMNLEIKLQKIGII